MNELNIYKLTAKLVGFTVLAMLLCRLSNGYFTPFFVFAGVWCAFSNKIGWALVYFVLMPFFVIVNPGIFPKSNPIVGYSLRFGPLLIGLLLAMMSGRRGGHHRLPLGTILPFMLVACMSSATGWVPIVSYMKIVNFIVFLLGIWYGTQNLQRRPKDVFILRSFFLAISVILIVGSVILIPFPTISYATSLAYALQEGGAQFAEDVYRTMQAEGMKTLFCGVTNHSQGLAPMLACSFAWVLCDMLFLERRFRKGHLILLLLALPLLYMTRSRVALVSTTFSLLLIVLYTSRKIEVPLGVRTNLKKGMLLFVGGVVLLAAVAQIKSGTMNEWLRKTNDTSVDRRSIVEALTESRQGLMTYCLWEFQRSPIIGSGFQVAEYTRDQMKRTRGLVISASVEKGVLPVMVLGETGILGEICFLFFLVAFFMICARRRFFVTITMFSVYLTTNMGEATFFSPGGGGGIMWMVCVVGGFTIDTTILYRRNLMAQWTAMVAEEQRQRELDMARYGQGEGR